MTDANQYSAEKIQLVRELHAPARKNFPRRRVVVKDVDDLWQIDLAIMMNWSTVNKNFKYILVGIDVFSKYGFAEPVKSKTGTDVTRAFENILQRAHNPPTNLQADKGSEFYNRTFLDLVKRNRINFYSSQSPLKASVCERFVKTLKHRLFKIFSLNGNYKWIDILQDVVTDYNNTRHRTIGLKPIQVYTKSPQQKGYIKHLKSTVYRNLKITGKHKFKVGDFVRVSKYKNVFAKGFTANWSTEVFKIIEIKKTNPVTYLLEDYDGERILGGFYEPELLRVKDPSVYLVEKIIKKRGDEVLVRWLGLDKKYDSWIHKRDIV